MAGINTHYSCKYWDVTAHKLWITNLGSCYNEILFRCLKFKQFPTMCFDSSLFGSQSVKDECSAVMKNAI